jgi:hypothetical protein
MGVKESEILIRAKTGQGEMNQRLDALVEEQRKTNQLLTDLLQALKTR